MAELTLKIASQLIGYTNADITIPVPDDITPEEIARLHWDWNMRFLLEQEKVANEPVTEKQEKEIGKAAKALTDEKLPATVVAEEKISVGDLALAASSGVGDVEAAASEYKVGDTVEVGGITFTKHSEAPWEEKPKTTASKPWDAKPSFPNLFG